MEVSQSNVLHADNNTNQTKGSYRNLKPPDQYVISYNFQHADSISFTHNLLIGMGFDQTRKITNKNKSFASVQSQKSKTLNKGSQWKQLRPNTQSVAQVYQTKLIPKKYIPPVSPKMIQPFTNSNFNESQATQNARQNIQNRDNYLSTFSQYKNDNQTKDIKTKISDNVMVSPYQQKLVHKMQKFKIVENKVLEDEREKQQNNNQTENAKILMKNQQRIEQSKKHQLIKRQSYNGLQPEEFHQTNQEKTLYKEQPQLFMTIQNQDSLITVTKQNQSQKSITPRLSTKIHKPQSQVIKISSKRQIQQDQLRLLQQQVRKQEGDKIRKGNFKKSFNNERQIFPFQANIEQFFVKQNNNKRKQDRKDLKQANNSSTGSKKQIHNGINHSTTQLMKRNYKPNTVNNRANQNQKMEVENTMIKQFITPEQRNGNYEDNGTKAMKRIASSNLNSLVANKTNNKQKNSTEIYPISKANKNRFSINNNRKTQNESNQRGEVDRIQQKYQINGVKIPQNIIKATSRNNQLSFNINQKGTRVKTPQNATNIQGNYMNKTRTKPTTILGTKQDIQNQQQNLLNPSKTGKTQGQKLKYSSSVDNLNNKKIASAIQPIKETIPRTAKGKQRNFKKWKQAEATNTQKESRSLKTKNDNKSKSKHEKMTKQKSESKGNNDKKVKQINSDIQQNKFGLVSENKKVKDGKENTNTTKNKQYNQSNDSKDLDELCPDIMQQSQNEVKRKESQTQIDASPNQQFTGLNKDIRESMKSHISNKQFQHHMKQQQLQSSQQKIQQKGGEDKLNISIQKQGNNNEGEILQIQPSLDHISRIGSSRDQELEAEIPFQINQNSPNKNNTPQQIGQSNQIQGITQRQDLQTLLEAANQDNSEQYGSFKNKPKYQKNGQLITLFDQQNVKMENEEIVNCNKCKEPLIGSRLNHQNESVQPTRTKQIKQYKFNEQNLISEAQDFKNLTKNVGNRSDDFFQYNIPQMSKGQTFNQTFNLTKYENFDRDISHYNRAPVLSFIYEMPQQTVQCQQKFKPSNIKVTFLHKLKESPQVGESLINQAINILLSIDSWILERIFEPYFDQKGKIGVWLYCHGIWKFFIENTAANFRTVLANAIQKAIASLNCGRELQKILRLLSGVRVMKLRSNKKKIFNELQYSMKKGHVLRAATATGSKWGQRLFEVVKVEVSKQGENVLQIRENNERVWVKQQKFKQIFEHFLLICTRQSHFWTTRQLKCLPSHKAVLTVSSIVPAHGSITLFYPSVAASSLLLYKQLESKVLRYLGKIDSKQNQNGNLYFQFRLHGTYCLFLQTPTDCEIAIESTRQLEIGCLEYIKSETLKNEQCEYIELNRVKGEKRQSGDNFRADETLQKLREKFIKLVVKK